MRILRLLVIALAIGIATPSLLLAFETLSQTLGIASTGFGYQRDFRVRDNCSDAAANDNLAAESGYPGARGAVLAVWKAAATWSSQASVGTGANFDFDYQGLANDDGGNDGNVVSWQSSCGSTGTLAYALSPIDNGWTIRFCDEWIWSDGPGAPLLGQYDIQGVATHELGHALGLDHTTIGCDGECTDDSTMCPFACGAATSSRTLGNDDLAGVTAIYGVATAGKPRITSLAGSSSINGTLTVHGQGFPATVNVKFTAGSSQDVGSIPGVVSAVPSSSGGTQLAVKIPSVARDGNVLLWSPQLGLLSNAFPIDIDAAAPVPPAIGAISPGTAQALNGAVQTLQGSGFLGATFLEVGAKTLVPPQFTVTNDQTITFAPPTASALGFVTVRIGNVAGTSNPTSLLYVETDPPLLVGPQFLGNGFTATWNLGTRAGAQCFLLVSGTGQAAAYNGQALLVPQLVFSLGATNAAGLMELIVPVNGFPVGANLFTQMAVSTGPNGGFALSNVHQTQVLF
jgi:hypothetical protein